MHEYSVLTLLVQCMLGACHEYLLAFILMYIYHQLICMEFRVILCYIVFKLSSK